MKLTIRNYYVPRATADAVKRDAVFIAGGATVWDADGVWQDRAAWSYPTVREPVAVVHVMVEPARAASMTHAVAQRLARHGESTMAWSSGTAGAVESLDAFRAALAALDAVVGLPGGARVSVDARTAYGDASAAIQTADAGLDPVDPVRARLLDAVAAWSKVDAEERAARVDAVSTMADRYAAESDADEYRGDVAGIIRDAHGLDWLADEVGGLSNADMLDHVAAGRTPRDTAAWYVAESDAADARRARDYAAECVEQRAALGLDDGRGMPGSTTGPARPATVPETLDRGDVLRAFGLALDAADDVHDYSARAALYDVAGELGLADALEVDA